MASTSAPATSTTVAVAAPGQDAPVAAPAEQPTTIANSATASAAASNATSVSSVISAHRCSKPLNPSVVTRPKGLKPNAIIGSPKLLLFEVGLDDLIGQGFGSRLWVMGSMYERFVYGPGGQGRVMAMSEETMSIWNAFGLCPPVVTAPQRSYWKMYSMPSSAGSVMMVPETLTPRISSQQAIQRWAMKPDPRTLQFQDMAGCWKGFDAFIWQTFEQAIAEHAKPFASSYIGIHVRHGDKASEGKTIGFEAIMNVVQTTPQWKDLRNFFVATDDANVLSQEVSQAHPPPGPGRVRQQDKYAWKWTDYERLKGGDGNNHAKSGVAIQAVLNDTISMGLASVLVGSWNSNFFKLAWLLNYLRRTPEQRQEMWCWDLFAGIPCHNRHDFVVDFFNRVNRMKKKVNFRPGNLNFLQSCQDPQDRPPGKSASR